jgi:hypothetical protein
MFHLVTPFLWSLFHPAHLIKTLRYRLLRKQLKNSTKDVGYIQTEANAIYEKNNFDIEFKYFSILKSLCICFFYLLIIPYGPMFAMFEMFLFYITDRFSITRRCLKLRNFDFILTIEVLSYFDICLIFLPMGYMIIYRQFLGLRPSFWIIASLCLTFIEAFIINIRILFACCKSCQTFEGTATSFEDISYEIKSYNDSNPATMEFYMYDDGSKNMLSVMYSPGHTLFTLDNKGNISQNAPYKQEKTHNEFNWEKLQTENSVIDLSSKKKDYDMPSINNIEGEISKGDEQYLNQITFEPKSYVRKNTLSIPKNQEINILSMVKMLGNKGPLISGGSKFHFEDKAETIQMLKLGKKNLPLIIQETSEEESHPQKKMMRSLKRGSLIENIKLNNKISVIMDHKSILDSRSQSIYLSIDNNNASKNSGNEKKKGNQARDWQKLQRNLFRDESKNVFKGNDDGELSRDSNTDSIYFRNNSGKLNVLVEFIFFVIVWLNYRVV